MSSHYHQDYNDWQAAEADMRFCVRQRLLGGGPGSLLSGALICLLYVYVYIVYIYIEYTTAHHAGVAWWAAKWSPDSFLFSVEGGLRKRHTCCYIASPIVAHPRVLIVSWDAPVASSCTACRLYIVYCILYIYIYILCGTEDERYMGSTNILPT